MSSLNPNTKNDLPMVGEHTPDMDMAKAMALEMAAETAEMEAMFDAAGGGSAGPMASLPASMFASQPEAAEVEPGAEGKAKQPEMSVAERLAAEHAESMTKLRSQFVNFPSDEDIAELKGRHPNLACVVSPSERCFYLIVPVARGRYRSIMKQVRALAESGKDEEQCTEHYNLAMVSAGVIYPPVDRKAVDSWPAFKMPYLFEAVRQRSCWANPQQIMSMTFEL